MSIKRIESDKRKRNYRYDGKSAKWVAYRVDVTSRGKRHRPVFPTKAEAERYIDQIRISSAYNRSGLKAPPGVRAVIRLSTLFNERLRWIERRKERVNAETAFARFREIVGFDAPVTEITKAHFQQYANARMRDVSPDTVRREMTRLASAFNTAEQMFPVELEGYEPPPIKRPRAKKRDNVMRRTITAEEKDLIADGLRHPPKTGHRQISEDAAKTMAAMFEIAWLLGLRYSEILGLKKTDFNIVQKRLRFRRFKTGTHTVIESLPTRAVEILSELSAASEGEMIFTRPVSSTGFGKALKRICEANGIPYGRGKEDGITFHSTRHSFTTRLVQVADIATAAALTGHSNKEMVAYYAHASEQSKANAMDAMYGSSRTDEILRLIYDRIAAGEMTFEQFRSAVLDLENTASLSQTRHASA